MRFIIYLILFLLTSTLYAQPGGGSGGSGGGDASAANQALMIAELGDINTALGGTLTVDNSGVTQPVSGTLTCDLGTVDNAVLDTIASETTSIDSKITACNTGAIAGSVTANAGTNLNTSALSTESTLSTFSSKIPTAATAADNTTNPSVSKIGSYNFVYDGSTWDRQPGTSADGTLVNLGSNNDVTVTSGSITANAGTNLNTSALALESGGNLAAITTAIQILDNIVSGAGINITQAAGTTLATNTGNATAGTPRVVLATDQPAVPVTATVSAIAQPTAFFASEFHATAQTANELVASPGSGNQLCITDVYIKNGGTGGTIKLVRNTGTPADITATVPLADDQGWVHPKTTPICITANQNLGFTSVTMTDTYIEVGGFIQAE